MPELEPRLYRACIQSLYHTTQPLENVLFFHRRGLIFPVDWVEELDEVFCSERLKTKPDLFEVLWGLLCR
jgi:hypothetical protein